MRLGNFPRRRCGLPAGSGLGFALSMRLGSAVAEVPVSRSRRSCELFNCSACRAPPAPLPRTCGVPSSAALAAGACGEGGRGLRFPWLKTSSLPSWWLRRISAFSNESSLGKSQGTSSTRCWVGQRGSFPLASLFPIGNYHFIQSSDCQDGLQSILPG